MNITPTQNHNLTKDFLIEDSRWKARPDCQPAIDRAVETARSYVEQNEAIAFMPDSELSIVLTDDLSIKTLNATHRGKDKATNVLSFPIDEEADLFGPLLGDIVFAYETIEREADDMGIEFLHHLAHLSVHGFLHLLGYDHNETDEAEKMEAVEIAILASLDIANPYAGSEPIKMPD